jgi:hypothetical protein
MSRRGSVLIGVVVGTLAAMLAGGIAWATIPGTDGVIHGCYKAKNGQLRLVDASSQSKHSAHHSDCTVRVVDRLESARSSGNPGTSGTPRTEGGQG